MSALAPSKTAVWKLAVPVAAMVAIVALSNFLVQFPVQAQLGPVNLADLFTWAAFSYPIAFLITDLTNRRFGPHRARVVVFIGFAIAVVASVWLSTPRIAIASGSAFLVAQLLDVSVFDRLRRGAWWHAPLASSVIGSLVDTLMFFSLAFAAWFAFIGPNNAFAIGQAPLLGVFALEAPRWVSWALGDLVVKILVALFMLTPYRLLRTWLAPRDYSLTRTTA